LQPITLADDGFVDVAIDGVTVKLDLFAINNEIYDTAEKLKTADPNVRNLAIADLIKAKGFPTVSTKLACDLAEAIRLRIEGIKKKDDDTPVSSGSTA
jgi:hypothetical protein